VAEVLIRTGFVLEGLQGLLNETRKFGQDVAAELNKSASGVKDGAGSLKAYATEAGRAKDANESLASSANRASSEVENVSRGAKQASGGIKVMDAAVAGLALSLTNTLTNAIGGAVAGLKGMVGDFLKLDGEIRKAAAAAGEQGAYDRLASVIDKVGIDAAGTTQQVAEMATSLVRAGFSVAETEQALGSIVRGAEATGTSFETMGDVVGATIKGFGLQATDAARVVDALAQGANSSATSVTGMGMAFKYAAPVAKVLGISVEDLGVAIGLMTNAGITAEMAGVTLRNGLTKLASAAPAAGGGMRQLTGQSALAAKAMKTLELDIYNANGTLKPMETVLLQLKGAFDKLAPSAKLRLASDMFGGEDDGTKWLSLLNQSREEIIKMSDTMANSKGAADTARTAMQGLGLELQQLTGTLGSIGNTMGGVLAAALRPLVGLLNTMAGVVAGLPGPLKVAAGALLALYAATVVTRVGVLALSRVLMLTTGAETARAAWLSLAAVLTGPVSSALKQVRVLSLALTAGGLPILGQLALLAAAIGAVYLIAKNAPPLFESDEEKVKKLEERIKTVKETIKQRTEFGLDTSKAQKDLAELERQQAELKREMRDKDFVKQLRSERDTEAKQADKGNKGAGAVVAAGAIVPGGGAVAGLVKGLLEGEQAAAGMRDALNGAIDVVQRIDDYRDLGGLSEPIKKAAKEAQLLRARIGAALRERASLPIEAKADKERLTLEIRNLQKDLDKRKLDIVLQVKAESLAKSLAKAQAQLKFKQGLPEFLRGDTKQLEAEISRLEVELAKAKAKPKTASAAIAPAAAVTLNSLREELSKAEAAIGKIDVNDRMGLQYARDNATALRRQIKEIEESGTAALQTAQREVELASQALQLEQQRNGLIKDRIGAQQRLQEAILNLAQAQEAAARSEFELSKTRNDRRQQQLEEELQMIKERGDAGRFVVDSNYSIGAPTVIDLVAQKERQIAEAKRRGREIEVQSVAATAQAATIRFELERRILAIKQAGQLLEAQSAVRTAQSGTLSAEKELLSLQQRRIEVQRQGGSDAELAQMDRQINLQNSSLALSRQQVTGERQRMQALGVIFGLEQQTLGLQQRAAANAIQSQAAGAGMERQLSGTLQKMQESAGAGLDLRSSVEQAGQQARTLTGVISAGGETIKLYGDLPKPMLEAANASNQMADGLAAAAANASALLNTLKAVAGLPRARWAGGGVEGGQRYQVNELGQESLLDRFGRLSLIRAGRSSMWTAPTSGTVLPAGITAGLASQGLIEGAGNMRRGAGGTVTASQAASSGGSALGRQVARLAAATGRLEQRMSELVAKRWDVTVALPSNASTMRLSQALS
jgi:TP901 family phage tail tape measure protein